MAKERAAIAITMGDAAGIGPEIIARVLLQKQIIILITPFRSNHLSKAIVQ